MRLRKNEKDALIDLAESGDFESSADFVEAMAKELDRLRGERTHIYACAIVAGIPIAMGPLATRNQAEKALLKLGYEKGWVVPGWTAEGWDSHLAQMDKPHERKPLTAKQEAAASKGFWSKVSEIREGERTAITGKVEIKRLVV